VRLEDLPEKAPVNLRTTWRIAVKRQEEALFTILLGALSAFARFILKTTLEDESYLIP